VAVDPIARTETKPINLYALSERLGIERGWGVLPRLALTHACAVRNCRGCDHAEACREWLSSASDTLTLPPSDCPNAGLLLEIAYDRPSACRKARAD
jgi:uncharacterized protein DUF6455